MSFISHVRSGDPPMRVLVIALVADKPSTRLRILPLVERLRQRGHYVGLIELPSGPIGRLGLLRQAASHDVVLLQKKLFPRAFVALLQRANPQLIFDVDDAVMFHELERGQALTGRFFQRFCTIARASLCVVAGNGFIAEHARAARPRSVDDHGVVVLPTPIDTDMLTMRPPDDNGHSPVIGWIGTKGNLRQLLPLAAALRDPASLQQALHARVVPATPAYPRNQRTVYRGHLFVGDLLLSDTGMRTHPLTPMTDANLVRLLAAQTRGAVGLVAAETLDAGPDAVRARLAALAAEGKRHAIVDAIRDEHLTTAGLAFSDLPLTTGGAGLGVGIARALRGQAGAGSGVWARPAVPPRMAWLSGSCSDATRRQVAAANANCTGLRLDPMALAADPGLASRIAADAVARSGDVPVLVYAVVVNALFLVASYSAAKRVYALRRTDPRWGDPAQAWQFSAMGRGILKVLARFGYGRTSAAPREGPK